MKEIANGKNTMNERMKKARGNYMHR